MIEPWIPKLVDVEYWKTNGNESERIYYSRFGWECLAVPQDCPTVLSRMDELKIRFDQRYGHRMLNAETMEYWQIRLQNRFDETVKAMERAYALYEEYKEEMMTDVIAGERLTVTSESGTGGSDTTSANSKSRTMDTPDSVLNADPNYADSLGENESESTVSYGRTVSGTTQQERTLTGDILNNINRSIDTWRDLDTYFISLFENNFLNVMWY